MAYSQDLSELEQKLGLSFRDPHLLTRAFTHSSYSQEMQQAGKATGCEDYERLEFLGDAVLELVTSQMLYQTYDWPEGRLTKTRAQIVCEESLSYIARLYGLGAYIRFSRGEEKTGGLNRPSILCDVVESLIGAVYLDKGLEAARALIERMLFAHLSEIPQEDETDFKSQLQELLQGEGRPGPTYTVIKEEGPPHRRYFTVKVQAGGKVQATGDGPSKKAAEQKAARQALAMLRHAK